MTIWEVEQFLNQTTDVEGGRSLSDAWDLDNEAFDKEVLLYAIMMKGGELAPVFNNIATVYRMSMFWWKKWKPTFEDWWNTEEKDYEPLWNKDYKEDEHTDDAKTAAASSTTKANATGTESTTDKLDVEAETDGNRTTTNEVSAYDAPSNDPYTPHDKSHTTYGEDKEAHSTDKANTNSTSSQDSATDAVTTTDGDLDRKYWGRGNIGVTSAQALYREEFETKYNYNPYQLMSDIFLKEMTDCVWV